MQLQTSRPLSPGAQARPSSTCQGRQPSPLLRLAAVASLAVLATGCASQHRFTVEAIKQTDTPLTRHSYQLVDTRPASERGDARWHQVARDVHTALSSRGLYAAPEGTTPELTIEVDYGISAPIVTRGTRSEPIYAVLPPQSSGGLRVGGGIGGAGALPTYLGSREIPYTIRTYRKFLRLTARETGPRTVDSTPRQVWSVLVTNEDKSNDLRGYTRLMIAAAMDSIDENVAEELQIALTPKDARVAFVASGSGSS